MKKHAPYGPFTAHPRGYYTTFRNERVWRAAFFVLGWSAGALSAGFVMGVMTLLSR